MGAVIGGACGDAVGVGTVRHDLAVVGPVGLIRRRAARRLLEETVARIEPRVAHADDLALAVQAHLPDRRRASGVCPSAVETGRA